MYVKTAEVIGHEQFLKLPVCGSGSSRAWPGMPGIASVKGQMQ
jgi:hypothetical protein